jgi:ribokinase
MRRRCSAETVALISTALGSQPAVAAARGARVAGAFVVVDLAGEPATAASVLDSADLVRGDSSEISVLVGVDVRDFATAARAAELLLARGPQIAVVQAGDLVLTPRQAVRLRRLPVTVVDPTGAGDAFVASLAVLLASGVELQTAAELAAAAAAAAHTVSHLSGRPAYAGLPELMAIRETGHVS